MCSLGHSGTIANAVWLHLVSINEANSVWLHHTEGLIPVTNEATQVKFSLWKRPGYQISSDIQKNVYTWKYLAIASIEE